MEIEVGDLSESVKENEVLSGPKEDDIDMDGPDVCGEQKTHDNDSPQMVCSYEYKIIFCKNYFVSKILI